MAKVRVELVKNRIYAYIPWEGGSGKELAKSIPGASPKFKTAGGRKTFVAWTYPADMATCYALRRVFGKSLRIGEELTDWAREELRREAAQLDLRAATDAELPRVKQDAPALYEAMCARPYQKAGARFAVDGRTVLIADEPGIGKTLETLAALVENITMTALVFAKKKAIETVWAAEVPRWLGDGAKVYPVVGAMAERRRVLTEFFRDYKDGIGRMQIVICNIEMVRHTKVDDGCDNCSPKLAKTCETKEDHTFHIDTKYPELFEAAWDAIVVDESHKALIGKSSRSKTVSQTRLGMMRLRLRANGMKIALSGTPWRNRPEFAWGTLNWLDKKVFSSYWRWVETYFEISTNDFNGREIGAMLPHQEAAYDRMLARWMIRRTKEEVAPDLPPKQYCGTPLDPADPHSTIGVWLRLEPKQAKRYQQIYTEGANDGILKLGSGRKIFLNGVLPELTRRKQFAICDWDEGEDGKLWPVRPNNSNKYLWLREFAEERADAGLKIVVASQYTKVVDAFSAWLRADGIESYTLTGATSERAATAIVAAFNDPSDPVPVFFLNTYAGGESINLDGCADDVVFIDETFIPDDQLQAEDRIHRMSRMHQVNVWHLRSLGTVEEDICRITGARELLSRQRLDGSRGVNILRKLLIG